MTSFDANEALLSGFQANPEPKWNDLPPMNEKRYRHAAVKLDQHRILVVGGFNNDNGNGGLSSTEMFDNDPIANRWESWPDLNKKRAGLAAALCSNKVYVFGGECLDSIECLDLSSEHRQWETMAVKLSCMRSGCTVAVVGSDIYIMGGHNPSSHCLSSVEILDTTTGTIKRGPSMTTAREGCVAGVVNNAIYVVGGRNADGNELDSIDYLTVDPRTKDLGKWQTCNATMLIARWYPAVAVVGHCLVIMGGDDNNEKDLSTVVVFDTRRDVCWRLPDLNQWRYACAAVTLKDSQVVVVGGYSNGVCHASVESLTLTQQEESLTTQVQDLRATVNELSERLTQSELTRKNDLQALEAKHTQELQSLEQELKQELDALERKRKQEYDTMQKELKRQKTQNSKATEWGCSISY